MVKQVTKNLKGSFFCDAGYLKNSKELVEQANSGRFIYAATGQKKCNFPLIIGQKKCDFYINSGQKKCNFSIVLGQKK